MKLEVGKRYVMRNGEVTGPLAPHDDSGIWLKDTEKNLTWMKVGGFWSANRNPYPQDIVAEYVEPDQSHDVQQPLRWVENCKPDKPGIWAWRYDTSRTTRPTKVVDLSEDDCQNCSTNGIEWCYFGPIPEILPPVKKVVQRLWVANAGGQFIEQWSEEGDFSNQYALTDWIRTDRTREREI